MVARLNQEIARSFKSPDISDRLLREGYEVVLNSPGEFDAFFRGEMEKWAQVIKVAEIRL